jgi:hypothetical protein
VGRSGTLMGRCELIRRQYKWEATIVREPLSTWPKVQVDRRTSIPCKLAVRSNMTVSW